MQITYDAAKNATNIRERGLSFECVVDFDFESAKVWQDTRQIYPEPRFVALGYHRCRLHVLCFTPVTSGIRVISFRKANQREGDKHGYSLTNN